MSKPQTDQRNPEDVVQREMIERYLGILRQYQRVAIAGGPRTGKSMLSRLTKDRRLFTAVEFEHHSWEDVPHAMLEETKDVPRFAIEGVMVARMLRKAAQLKLPPPVDAVVWMREPKVAQNSGQAAMTKGITKIFNEWRRADVGIPVFEL